MSWANVASEVKNLVSGVSGVPTDNVYSRKVMYDKGTFETLFHSVTYNTYMGWEIYKKMVSDDDIDTSRTLKRSYACGIHAFISIEDNAGEGRYSYTTLEDLTEDVRDELTVNRQVNDTILISSGPTQDEISEELWEGIWMWGTEISWVLDERITLSEDPS